MIDTFKIFIKHSGIYFYLFVLLILAIVGNNLLSENRLHNEILKSKAYNEKASYTKNDLIHITDKIKVYGEITDEESALSLTNIVVLRKKIEMFSWVRKYINKHTTYEKSWEVHYIEKPSLLTNNYNNPWPRKKLGIFYYYPDSIYLGNFKIPQKNFDADSFINVKFTNSQISKENGYNYIYYGKSDLNNPRIGDIRIRYDVYKANQKTTIFITYDNKIKFENDIYKSIYNKDLFLTFLKGDINDVYNSFIINELKWKFLIKILLSVLLFITVFKMIIVIFNMNLKKEIDSILIKNLIVFFIIIPSSILFSYLVTKLIG
jgi:hypothetical protein